MTEFAGIPISESRLLMRNVGFTAIFVVALGLSILFAYMIWDACKGVHKRANKPEGKRMEKLAKLAQTEDWAKQEYDKRLKKLERERTKDIRSNIFNVLLLVIMLAVSVTSLVYGVIPGWQDYCSKDYFVYSGDFTNHVYTHKEKDYTDLDDGTQLLGTKRSEEGKHTGTVIYSKRTKIFLGAKETE